jgi:hypothetical protein
MKQTHRLGEVLETVQPKVLDLDVLAQLSTHLRRQQHLPAMRRRPNPGRAVDLDSDQPIAPTLHSTSVHSHPHPHLAYRRRPLVTAQPPLSRRCRRNRVPAINERGKERVPLGIHHPSSACADRAGQDPAVLSQDPRPISPERPRQPGRALDVGEQHRQLLAWTRKLAHGHLIADPRGSVNVCPPEQHTVRGPERWVG